MHCASVVQALPLGEHLPPLSVATQMSLALVQGMVALHSFKTTGGTPPDPPLPTLMSPPCPNTNPPPLPLWLLPIPAPPRFGWLLPLLPLAEHAAATPRAISTNPAIRLDTLRRSVIRSSVTSAAQNQCANYLIRVSVLHFSSERATFSGTMRSLPALLLLLVTFLLSSVAQASEPGEELTISLLTMGPGEHPFTKFGHSAIWVHDARDQRDEIYNYGTFAFDSPTLIIDSVAGKLPYWLSVQSLFGTLHSYREQGRSLVASELELTPAQRVALYAALRENARPEHRYYRYDYFRDNCATRVRDAFDRVLGGQIHEQTGQPARMSYRSHMLRLVADDPLLYAGLDLTVGRQSDTPIKFWDEGFLPQRLHDLLRMTHVTQGGRELPLIRSEHELLSGQIPEPRTAPPSWLGRYLLLGVLLGGGLVGLAFAVRRRPGLRLALGLSYVLLGLLSGLLGCALCYLTFFSAHSAAASNYNVLLCPPWLLSLVPAGIGVLRGKHSAWKILRWATQGAALSAVLALIIHIGTRNAQANAQELALTLPLWLGAALSARVSYK